MVHLPAHGVTIDGDLLMPPDAKGVVVFAHGSGSSRFSPRNRFVAGTLHERGIGTFLLDLLTAAEESIDDQTGHLRFDIELLASRLVDTAAWAMDDPATRGQPIGLFGASTGAAAALVAASERPAQIAAVVSRGGRPDLAGPVLQQVRAPTLLIVGGNDDVVIELNRQAYRMLECEKKMEIVPGASHLFEERGALDRVAELAGEWFAHWLPTFK